MRRHKVIRFLVACIFPLTIGAAIDLGVCWLMAWQRRTLEVRVPISHSEDGSSAWAEGVDVQTAIGPVAWLLKKHVGWEHPPAPFQPFEIVRHAVSDGYGWPLRSWAVWYETDWPRRDHDALMIGLPLGFTREAASPRNALPAALPLMPDPLAVFVNAAVFALPVAGVRWLVLHRREAKRRAEGRCPKCGYTLGIAGPQQRCPECSAWTFGPQHPPISAGKAT